MKKSKIIIKIVMVLTMIFYQLSPAATVLAAELEESITAQEEETSFAIEENNLDELKTDEQENLMKVENFEEEQQDPGESTTALDDDFFNEIYAGEIYFVDGYIFTYAKGFGGESIPTVEELQNGLIEDITLTVRNGEEEITTGEIKNGYEVVFTDNNNDEVTYIVIIYGDNNSDNEFNENDIEVLLNDYLEGNSVPSMDVIAYDNEVFGTITFEDVAIFNDVLNNHEDIIDNTDLNLSLESDASEVYVGDIVNFTVTINSSNYEDFIDGLEGIISNTNFELTEVKFNDNLVGTYNGEGKFACIGKPLYNENIVVTLVMTAKEAGTGFVSISGNFAKYLDMDEFDLSTEVTILEKEDNTDEDIIIPEEVIEENDISVATPVVYYYYYSSNSNLKSLEISDFDIDFDKDIREYRITVSSDVDSLDIKALAEDYGARVEITGNENFKTGENIILITVTAEDGSTSIYKLIVDKKAPEKKTLGEVDESSNTVEKIIIIILIILVVLGLLYLIFKKDEEEEISTKKVDDKVEKKEVKHEKNESKKISNNNTNNKQNIKKKK